MGGLIDNVFGGGGAKASKKSLEFMKEVHGENKGLAQPWMEGGLGSFNLYNSMLGGPGQDEAFQKWLGSSDYGFTTKAGMEAITQNMASKGLLNSGSTLKALTQFGQDNAQQYRNNYMNQLMGSAQIGSGMTGNLMGANQNMAQMQAAERQAGAQAKANGVGNFMNFGLGLAGLIPSDERLKTDIKKIGTMGRGKRALPIYTYRYKGMPDSHIGVMAQDVAKRRPNALGPKTPEGFLTIRPQELAHA